MCLFKTGRKVHLFGSLGDTESFSLKISTHAHLTPKTWSEPKYSQSDLVLPYREEIPDSHYLLWRWGLSSASPRAYHPVNDPRSSCYRHDYSQVPSGRGIRGLLAPQWRAQVLTMGYRVTYFSMKAPDEPTSEGVSPFFPCPCLPPSKVFFVLSPTVQLPSLHSLWIRVSLLPLRVLP